MTPHMGYTSQNVIPANIAIKKSSQQEKQEFAFVRLMSLRAKTASALKSTPGPSSKEKTMLV